MCDHATLSGKFTLSSGVSTWVSAGELIDGSLVVTGTLAADRIQANSITASQIATGAITANMVTTGTGNDRIEITNTAIKVYNGGVLRVKIGDLS